LVKAGRGYYIMVEDRIGLKRMEENGREEQRIVEVRIDQ